VKIEGTILVIEDNPANYNLVKDILESRGAVIMVAITGEDALKILEEKTIDLIILDLLLPTIDGYEVARRIRKNERVRDLPIIAVTANANPDTAQKVFSCGCNEYITKPFDTRKFPEIVKSFLKGGKTNE